MTNPFQQFSAWFEVAKNHPAISEPTAMTLATATKAGVPSARMVLLKAFDERGFVFYTNLESRKGGELAENPNVALIFYWMPLKRQIRVEGRVEKVSDEEADAYFARRPLQSKLGAWASAQSRPLDSNATLMKDVALYGAKYLGQDVPRPPHWSGFRVIPHRIEFWEEVQFRLHEREVYVCEGEGWTTQRLYP